MSWRKLVVEKHIDCSDFTCDNCPHLEHKSIDCFCATLKDRYINSNGDVHFCSLLEEKLDFRPDKRPYSSTAIRCKGCLNNEKK